MISLVFETRYTFSQTSLLFMESKWKIFKEVDFALYAVCTNVSVCVALVLVLHYQHTHLNAL